MITGMPRIAVAVHDFDACVDRFRDEFGMPVVDLTPGSVESLGAKLAMCVPEGGSNIELMSPANPETPLSQSLSRFLERRGEGLFALMLEAPEPDEEAKGLADRGLNVLPLMAGASGRDVHPNSTHGVLIRVYPVNSFSGAPSPSTSGLSGIIRVVVAVRDLGHARRVYQTGFGLACDPEREDAARGVRGFICSPPTGGVIEFVSPNNAARSFARGIASFLDEREGLYALVSHAAEDRNPTTVCGARIFFERTS
ncbi:MAG: VOC family protein [Gammaproteobacteria bacterium]|nr:VOC family protein [Gammaproteobacteria bacterium]